MMTQPMVQVFVSSTWLDLQPERAAVVAVLQRLRETKFLGMEAFGSRDESTRRASLDEVDRSQVYLGLFAGRYGSGITEDEYRRARRLDLPCFIYFKAEQAIPARWRETNPALAAKLAMLKQELRRHHTVTEFRTPEDLAAPVATDLHRWLVEEYLEPKLAQGARGEVPRAETEHLLAAIQDLSTLNQQVLARLRDKGFVIAKGERSVAAEHITDSAIVTGNGNTVVQNRGSGALAVGSSNVVAGQGGVAIGGDVRGSVFLASPGTDPVQAVLAYRRTLVTSYRQLSLRGMDIGASDPTSGQKQLELDQVYVNLDTTEMLGEEKPADAQGRPFRRPPTTIEKRRLTALEAVATAQSRRAVILGDPGSGKSTFLNHLALCLASHALEPAANWLSHLPGWPPDEGDLLPIPVVLRDFARNLPGKPGPAEACHLWDFILRRLRAQNLEAAETPLRQALEDGQAIVLLDGLDEISTASQRAFVRDAVLAFAGRYAKSRFIVTCRTLSYQDRAWQLPYFPAFTLAAFDEQKIDRFIVAWFADLARLQVIKTDDAPHFTSSLQTAVRRPDLWRLAPNPMLLTVMALVHTHKGRLPDARALLYEDTVDILLWRWEQMKASRDTETPGLRQLMNEAGFSDVDLKRALWRLAFETHRLGGAKKKRDEPHTDALADIEEAALHDALAELHPRNHECRAWVGQVIETIKLRAGLLVERVAHVFTFPHRTFQEYLAGAHLASLPDFSTQASQLAAEGPLWREVILLAVGRLVYLGGDIFKPLALVAELCPENAVNTELGWRQSWMAGDVILEAGLQRVRTCALGRDLLARVRDRLAKLLEAGALTPVERAAAGVALGKLGDPRPGVGLKNGLPDLDWIEISPGPFPMGNNKPEAKYDDEIPRFTCELITKPYRISRYPVTVAQFQAFVDAGGYDDKARNWWTKEGWRWKEDQKITGPEDYDPAFQTPNHPRVGVSCFEAVAFCRWLSERLQQRIALPSEVEWERAARHTDARAYPWPDPKDKDKVAADLAQRCNMNDTSIGHTSAVGMFPNGLAQCGAADMAGNVWEWCRTKWRRDYRDYEKKVDDALEGTDVRVLRGGSWFNVGPALLRCSSRNVASLDGRHAYIGFRCVVVMGGSAPRWRHRKMSAMPDGRTACPASAKKSPNRLLKK
jgi:formylglycine-generating enzyme required for sulfatase activity